MASTLQLDAWNKLGVKGLPAQTNIPHMTTTSRKQTQTQCCESKHCITCALNHKILRYLELHWLAFWKCGEMKI